MSDFETNPVPEQEQLQLLAKVRHLEKRATPGPSFHLRDLRIEQDGSLILDGEVQASQPRSLRLSTSLL